MEKPDGAPDLAIAKETQGVVFDIERCSLHDGQGIRTVVFLKGCPLHCAWCSNPESNKAYLQIGFFREKCAFCKKCADLCPNGGYFVDHGDIDWAHCTGCLKCVDTCLYEARIAYGYRTTAEMVLKRVLHDRIFYQNSNGGVTLSGGEVSMQPEFAEAILTLCQHEKIHTAIETSGFCSWSSFERIIAHTDQLLFDFKCMDPEKHLRYTGVDNRVILENACKAARVVRDMIVRWPVIPGVNDTNENAESMAAFITARMPNIKRVDLLPYHSAGKSKCERIGKEYGYEAPYELSAQRIAELQAILLDAGLCAKVGG